MLAIIREEIGHGLLGPRWRALGTVSVPEGEHIKVALVIADQFWPDRAVVDGKRARRMAESHPTPTVHERMADEAEDAQCALIARWRDACRRARPEGM